MTSRPAIIDVERLLPTAEIQLAGGSRVTYTYRFRPIAGEDDFVLECQDGDTWRPTFPGDPNLHGMIWPAGFGTDGLHRLATLYARTVNVVFGSLRSSAAANLSR